MHKAARMCAAALAAWALAVGASAESVPLEENLAADGRTIDVRSAALAGSTVARARGLDALSTNPAGLAALAYSEVSGSLFYNGGSLETQLGTSPTASSSWSDVRFGHIGIAHRFYEFPWLGVAASYQHSRGLSGRSLVEGVETLGQLAGSAIREEIETDGNVHALSLGAGFEVARGVRVGIALNQWDGARDRHIRYEAGDTYLDDIRRDISATRLKLGAEVGLTPIILFGASAHLPADVDIREDWSQVDRSRDRDNAGSGNSGLIKYDFHIPLEIEIGSALKLYRWRISGAIRHARWTDARYSTAPAKDVDADQFETLYQNETELKLGAEHWFENDIALRGGLRFGSPKLSSDWKSYDRAPLALSMGAGLPMGRAAFLDLAYEFSAWERSGDDLNESRTGHRFLAGGRLLF